MSHSLGSLRRTVTLCLAFLVFLGIGRLLCYAGPAISMAIISSMSFTETFPFAATRPVMVNRSRNQEEKEEDTFRVTTVAS